MVKKRFDIESRFKTLRDTKRNTPMIQNPPNKKKPISIILGGSDEAEEEDTIGEIAVKGQTGTLAFGNILYNMQDPISSWPYTISTGKEDESVSVKPLMSYTNCYIEIPTNGDSKDSGNAAYQNLLTAVGALVPVGRQYINTYTESSLETSLETSELLDADSVHYLGLPSKIPQPWSFINPVKNPKTNPISPVKIGLKISNSGNNSGTSLDGNKFIFYLTVFEKYLPQAPAAPAGSYCGDFVKGDYLYYFVCDAVQVNEEFYDFLCGLPCQVNNYCIDPPGSNCGSEAIFTNGITITPQFNDFQYCFTIYSVVLPGKDVPFIAIYQNIIPFKNVTQPQNPNIPLMTLPIDYLLNGYVLTGYVPLDYNASCTGNAQPVSSNAAKNQSICEFAGQSVPRTYVTDFSQYTNLDFANPVLFYVDNIYLVTLIINSSSSTPTKFTIEGKTYDFVLGDKITSKLVYPDIIYHIAGWQLTITTPLTMRDKAAVNITYIQS